jgi:ankyrin repeat protein
LSECCRLGILEAVQLLCEDIEISPHDVVIQSDSCLHQAAKGGHLEVVKYLVERARINASETIQCTKVNAVHSAAKRGHLPVVSYLVQSCHVDPNAVDFMGRSALHHAAENGHTKVVRFLCEKGNVNPALLDGKGRSSLELASRSGYTEIIRYLVESSGILSPSGYRTKKILLDALMVSCEQGNIDIVSYFISRVEGIESGFSYLERVSCVLKAVYNGHWNVVQLLLPWIITDENVMSTVFRTAATKGQTDILKYLIRVSRPTNVFLPDSVLSLFVLVYLFP